MRITFVADRRFERKWLLGNLQGLAHFFKRHAELLGKLLRRRLAADLIEHLSACAYDLVDGLDHMYGDTDGARLIGKRAADRLADPPRGIGRELVAASIFKFVDRSQEANVSFLDEVQELQAAIGVFLRDRNHEAEIRLHHLLLGLARLALALLYHLNDLAEFADLEPRLTG